MSEQPRLLINLPPTFRTQPELQPHWERLAQLAALRHTAHNTWDDLRPDLAWADAVLMWGSPVLGSDQLAAVPKLRFVGQLNTNRPTARACLAHGVALSEARHCWSPAVAEMALALILTGLRHTSAYHAAMRAGTEAWVDQFPADIDPLERELTGQPVGIVGFGQIGQRLARLLAPFAVELRIFDPFLPPTVAQQHNAQPAALLDLIRSSNVVVLCAANTAEAAHLIDRTAIAALRPNAVFVNVGRSMLVDMPALIERLERGDLIAMLDVFDREPLEADSPLRHLPNTFLTPHRAGGLLSSVQRGLTMLTDDFAAFQAGQERRYAVTEAMLHSFSGA